MGLYVGRDDSGNPLLSMTKWPHNPPAHKQWPPVPDKYLDSRLPYVRIIDFKDAVAVKNIFTYPSGGGRYQHVVDYKATVPAEIQNYVLQGYLVILGWYRISVTSDQANWHRLRNSTIRDEGFLIPGQNEVVTRVSRSVDDITGPSTLPQQVSVYSLLSTYQLKPYLDTMQSGAYRLEAPFFQVLNLRYVNGSLEFVDFDKGSDDIYISRDEVRAGNISFRTPKFLTLKKSVIGNQISGPNSSCIFQHPEGTNSFLGYLGNNNHLDRLYRIMDWQDYASFYELIQTQPNMPTIGVIRETGIPMFLDDPNHPYFD